LGETAKEEIREVSAPRTRLGESGFGWGVRRSDYPFDIAQDRLTIDYWVFILK
jgi:hypothetical protein